MSESDSTEPNSAEPDSTEPDSTASDRSEPDSTESSAAPGHGSAPTAEPVADGAAALAPAPAEAVSSAAPPPSPADTAQLLKQLFPALFGGPVKPLKLRIQVDIQGRAPGRFSKQALSAFFRRHTGSTSYLLAVSKAPCRYDLDGQAAGEISAEHRQVALDELTRRRENQQSRRELDEQQRRNRAGLLHDFLGTTLTKANFCALKGVPLDELDGLLEIARNEAKEQARQRPIPQQFHGRPMGRGSDRQPRGSGGAPASRGRR